MWGGMPLWSHASGLIAPSFIRWFEIVAGDFRPIIGNQSGVNTKGKSTYQLWERCPN